MYTLTQELKYSNNKRNAYVRVQMPILIHEKNINIFDI